MDLSLLESVLVDYFFHHLVLRKVLVINLNLDQKELESFIDNFWRDKEVGIDYPGFLRIFSKYQVKLSDEKAAMETDKKVHITDETIILKKNIFDQINKALIASNTTIADLFRRIDVDGSHMIDEEELKDALDKMKIRTTSLEIQ